MRSRIGHEGEIRQYESNNLKESCDIVGASQLGNLPFEALSRNKVQIKSKQSGSNACSSTQACGPVPGATLHNMVRSSTHVAVDAAVSPTRTVTGDEIIPKLRPAIDWKHHGSSSVTRQCTSHCVLVSKLRVGVDTNTQCEVLVSPDTSHCVLVLSLALEDGGGAHHPRTDSRISLREGRKACEPGPFVGEM